MCDFYPNDLMASTNVPWSIGGVRGKMNCVERRNKFSIENILRPIGRMVHVSGSSGGFNLHHMVDGKDEVNLLATVSSIKATSNLLDHITRDASGPDDESAHITPLDPVADAVVAVVGTSDSSISASQDKSTSHTQVTYRRHLLPELPKEQIQEPSKRKRARTAFTSKQIQELEAEFDKSKYLTNSLRTRLSLRLGLTETQIKIWFQNRRTKWKRRFTQNLESAAHLYYTAMGVKDTRPLVIGDRLWLFNSPPASSPAPPQAIVGLEGICHSAGDCLLHPPTTTGLRCNSSSN